MVHVALRRDAPIRCRPSRAPSRTAERERCERERSGPYTYSTRSYPYAPLTTFMKYAPMLWARASPRATPKGTP